MIVPISGPAPQGPGPQGIGKIGQSIGQSIGQTQSPPKPVFQLMAAVTMHQEGRLLANAPTSPAPPNG